MNAKKAARMRNLFNLSRYYANQSKACKHEARKIAADIKRGPDKYAYVIVQKDKWDELC